MPQTTETLQDGSTLTRDVESGIGMAMDRRRRRERVVLFPGTPAETVVIESGLVCVPDGGRAFVYQGTTGLSHSEAQELRRKSRGEKAPVLSEKDLRRIADERSSRRSEAGNAGYRAGVDTPEDELSRLLRTATSQEMKRAIINEWSRKNAGATEAAAAPAAEGLDLRGFVTELGAAWRMLKDGTIERPAYDEMKAKLIAGCRAGADPDGDGVAMVLDGLVSGRAMTKAEALAVRERLTGASVAA